MMEERALLRMNDVKARAESPRKMDCSPRNASTLNGRKHACVTTVFTAATPKLLLIAAEISAGSGELCTHSLNPLNAIAIACRIWQPRTMACHVGCIHISIWAGRVQHSTLVQK